MHPIPSFTCIWSTWDRLPLIWENVESRLFPALLARCQELKCEALALGGAPDHVHILVRFSPTITIAKLVQELKGSTSHLMTHEITPGEFFKWQGAYRAFTVAHKDFPVILKYIAH